MASKRRKHVPLRTCIACRQKRPKQELLRVVRRPEGTIELDSRGKLSGRGAYLCRTPECWTAALERNMLARALRSQVSAEQEAELESEFALLLAQQESSG
jgi:predicted RNA-binding protein YlxR (DUF448 family)